MSRRHQDVPLHGHDPDHHRPPVRHFIRIPRGGDQQSRHRTELRTVERRHHDLTLSTDRTDPTLATLDASGYGRIIRYAISLPQHLPDGSFRPNEFRDYLTRAEQLGFESAWITEQVLGRIPHPSPLEIMAYAAAVTEEIRLGCSVFVTPLHSPVHLAKSISTLDQLSRGRLEIGVGIGGRNRMFSAFGVDPDDGLVTRFVEGIQVMKALWTEPEASVTGRFWQLDAAPMEPKPFQKPYPPLWFGGSHPAALRRAVRLGDGFFGAGSSTTASFIEQVRTVRSMLVETGRDAATFGIAKRVYVAVDDDPRAGAPTDVGRVDRLLR